MTLNQEMLLEIIPLVGQQIESARAATASIDWRDYAAHREARKTADEAMKAFFVERYDARFTDRPPHDHTVTMAGIRSTSTGGWTGALQNWKRAAENKVAAAAGAVHRDGFNPHGSGPVPIEPREG